MTATITDWIFYTLGLGIFSLIALVVLFVMTVATCLILGMAIKERTLEIGRHFSLPLVFKNSLTEKEFEYRGRQLMRIHNFAFVVLSLKSVKETK